MATRLSLNPSFEGLPDAHEQDSLHASTEINWIKKFEKKSELFPLKLKGGNQNHNHLN